MLSLQIGDVRKVSLWHPPDLCGVLEKQVRKGGGWHPRYFVLKGSNLFWFTSPTSKKPKGNVPLEGASVHAVRPPALSVYSQQLVETDASGLPALYGIVILLDDAYALSPGGRSELVVAASTAELQALWTRALEQASIPRPELLARLQEHSMMTESLTSDMHPEDMTHTGSSQHTYSIPSAYDIGPVPLPPVTEEDPPPVSAYIHPAAPMSPRLSGYQKSRLSRAASPEPARESFNFPTVHDGQPMVGKMSMAAEYAPPAGVSFVYAPPNAYEVAAARQSALASRKMSAASQAARGSVSPVKARADSLLSGLRSVLPSKASAVDSQAAFGAYFRDPDGAAGRTSALPSADMPQRATINVRSAAASDAWSGFAPGAEGAESAMSTRRSVSPPPVRAQALATAATRSSARSGSPAPPAPAGSVGGSLVHDIVGHWGSGGGAMETSSWPADHGSMGTGRIISAPSYPGNPGGFGQAPPPVSPSSYWTTTHDTQDTMYTEPNEAHTDPRAYSMVGLPAVPGAQEGVAGAVRSPRAESVASVEMAARDAALATLASVQSAARQTTMESIAAVQRRAARESALASEAALREQSTREQALASIAALHRQVARESALLSIATVQQQVAHAAELLTQHADRLQSGAPIDSLNDEHVINSLPLSPPAKLNTPSISLSVDGVNAGGAQDSPLPGTMSPTLPSTSPTAARGTRATSDFFISAFGNLQSSLDAVNATLNNLVHTAANAGTAGAAAPAAADAAAQAEPSFDFPARNTVSSGGAGRQSRATSASVVQPAGRRSSAAGPLQQAAQQLHACLGVLQEPEANLRAPDVQALTAELAAVTNAIDGLNAQMSARGSAIYTRGNSVGGGMDTYDEDAWVGPQSPTPMPQARASMGPSYNDTSVGMGGYMQDNEGGARRPSMAASPRGSQHYGATRQSVSYSRGASESYAFNEGAAEARRPSMAMSGGRRSVSPSRAMAYDAGADQPLPARTSRAASRASAMYADGGMGNGGGGAYEGEGMGGYEPVPLPVQDAYAGRASRVGSGASRASVARGGRMSSAASSPYHDAPMHVDDNNDNNSHMRRPSQAMGARMSGLASRGSMAPPRDSRMGSWQPAAPYTWDDPADRGERRASVAPSVARRSTALPSMGAQSRMSVAEGAGNTCGAYGQQSTYDSVETAATPWPTFEPQVNSPRYDDMGGYNSGDNASMGAYHGDSRGGRVSSAAGQMFGGDRQPSFAMAGGEGDVRGDTRGSGGRLSSLLQTPSLPTNISPPEHVYDVPFSAIPAQRPTRVSSAASSGWVDVAAAARRASVTSNADAGAQTRMSALGSGGLGVSPRSRASSPPRLSVLAEDPRETETSPEAARASRGSSVLNPSLVPLEESGGYESSAAAAARDSSDWFSFSAGRESEAPRVSGLGAGRRSSELLAAVEQQTPEALRRARYSSTDWC